MSATSNTDGRTGAIATTRWSPTSHHRRYVCDPAPMTDRSPDTGPNLAALSFGCMAISLTLTLFSVAAAEKTTSLSENGSGRIVMEQAKGDRDGHLTVDSRLGDVLHHPVFAE